RIGYAADRDRLRLPVRREELLAQQLRRILLHHDLRLEVETGREAEVLVRRTGKAVRASVLAAAIRVDAVLEADVGRVVARDDGPRRIAQVNRSRHALVALRLVIDDVGKLLEPVLRVPAGAASPDWSNGCAHIVMTAVPWMSPARRASSASFARSSGNLVRCVSIRSVRMRSKKR